MDDTVELMKYL